MGWFTTLYPATSHMLPALYHADSAQLSGFHRCMDNKLFRLDSLTGMAAKLVRSKVQ
ncbi:hypothetical protein [Snodgrassella alvi]|uniref:hypothetical protein n=1 Tax=Snodgrassella alvi TaxID=1196083 RepID=UPI0015D566CA|nr:hypothetical protein [Snodgrassella alvi]